MRLIIRVIKSLKYRKIVFLRTSFALLSIAEHEL